MKRFRTGMDQVLLMPPVAIIEMNPNNRVSYLSANPNFLRSPLALFLNTKLGNALFASITFDPEYSKSLVTETDHFIGSGCKNL